MRKWRMGLRDSGDRLWLTGEFTHDIREVVKATVPGIRWDDKAQLWHAPLDLEVARDISRIAKQFDVGIRVEPELVSWVKGEKERFASVLKPDNVLSDQSKLLPRCRTEYPQIIEAMNTKPWQMPGAHFLAEQRNVLLADEPGLGKTLQTLAAIVEDGTVGPILVVAPKTAVAATWPEEIAQWLGTNEVVFSINGDLKPLERKVIADSVRDWANAAAAVGHSKRVWVLISPNYLRIRADPDENGNYLRDSKGRKIVRAVGEALPALFGIDWAAVVVDESHQTLAGATGSVKKQSAQRRGLGALNLELGAMRIAISGTPFRGKTENLWGTLNWLYPDKYTSYRKWIERHYGSYRDYSNPFGSGFVKGDKIIDEKRFFAELKPLMVRRTKSEVAKWLPAKRYGGTHLDPHDDASPVAVWLPMSDKQTKQYNQIVREAILTLDSLGDELTINGILAEMIRLKQVANACLVGGISRAGVVPTLPSNKIEWIHNFLVDRITVGSKVIVASQFTQFLELLSGYLDAKGMDHYKFTGKTSSKDRTWIKTEFQSVTGDSVILLNTASGGVSLTLDLADDVVVCDQTWIPDDQTQVEDRAHRISRNHKLTIWNLASRNTIDEDIAQLNADRAFETALIDRQRGVSFAKELVAVTKKRIEAA
jgi:SNF2 family DNA or RNA helicase